MVLLQKYFPSFQAFHILKNITVPVVPDWPREMLFQDTSGEPVVCVADIFKHRCAVQSLLEWTEQVSYPSGPAKYALPQNVTD